MPVLNYRAMVTKNYLLYTFSDEIEEKNEEKYSYNFNTKAKYKKKAEFLSVVSL
jgi:hypothetical protein